MFTELQFVVGILLFAAVALAMWTEDYLAEHVFTKESLCRRLAHRLAKRYPTLCDNGDTFYSFFHRDTFHRTPPR